MPVFAAKTLERHEAASTKGGGGYLNTSSIQPGESVRFTILGCDGSDAGSIDFYEIWGESLTEKRNDGAPLRKCIRFAEEASPEAVNERFEELGLVRCTNKFGKAEVLKHVMAFWVWNYDSESVEVFAPSQQTIQEQLIEAFQDEEVATSPSKWDLSLSKKQGGKMIEYSISLRPGKRADKVVNARIEAEFEAVLDKGGNLAALISGGNPFGDDKVPF